MRRHDGRSTNMMILTMYKIMQTRPAQKDGMMKARATNSSDGTLLKSETVTKWGELLTARYINESLDMEATFDEQIPLSAQMSAAITNIMKLPQN